MTSVCRSARSAKLFLDLNGETEKNHHEKKEGISIAFSRMLVFTNLTDTDDNGTNTVHELYSNKFIAPVDEHSCTLIFYLLYI